MTHRKILTIRQYQDIFALPTDERRLTQFYTLDDDDIELISKKRREENRLGFALQLCVLRYPGKLLEVGEAIPLEVLEFIGMQIGISAEGLAGYASRRQTRYEHMDELRLFYGYQMFSGAISKEMRSWIFSKSTNTGSTEKLLQDFVTECRIRKIVLPAFSTIERLCADAMVAAERVAEAEIAMRLTRIDQEKLGGLLEARVDGRVSRFIWLRQFETGNNSADMNQLLDKLEFIQSVKIHHDVIAKISSHHIVRLRRQGERYFTGDLHDLSSNRRLAILAVCAIEWRLAIADVIVETHDRIVGRTWREAQRVCDETFDANKQTIDQTLKGLSQIGQELIEAKNSQQSLGSAISWDTFEKLITAAKSLTSATGAEPIHFVSHGYHRFRRYVPRMLELLEIKAAPVAQDLLEALGSIRDGSANGSLAFLKRGSKWRAELKDEYTGRLWEVAVLFHMRESFRSGDLWLAHSRRFGDWKQSLVPLPAVQTAPKIAVPDDPLEWISAQRTKLGQAFGDLVIPPKRSGIENWNFLRLN